MLKSLYSGVSGLSVNQNAMDVIGNNLANVNTIGFKQSRAVFQDLMSQTLIGGKIPTDSRGGINPRQVGSGAYLAAVDNIFSNGVIKGTQKTTDLAIQGNGMFVLRGEGIGEYFYTRAGDFNFDRNQTLTSPSGYKVQGWMADVETGVVRKDGGVSDIVLDTAYQVMKPRASSEINFAGTLDTTAKASILKYPQFLTQATAQQKISTLKSEGGNNIDLGNNEKVTIRAHATEKTFMSSLFNSSGSPMNLSDGNMVTFYIGTTPYSVTYKAIDKGNPNDGEFNSVESFINEVNHIFETASADKTKPLGKMSIEGGKFKITGNSSFEITQINSSSNLATLLFPLVGTYGSGFAKQSNEAFFQKDVISTENFNNLTELGVQVQNALNGSVVVNGFNVEFLDNNFGLREGERVTFKSLKIDGQEIVVGTKEVSFTYTEADTSEGTKFHTIQQLASRLTSEINQAAKDKGLNTSITFGVVNNQIQLTHQTGAKVEFGPVELKQAVDAGALKPNPYLENLLTKSLNGKTIDSTNKSLVTDEIAGKGRLAYNYAKTAENATTLDLANNNFGMKAGEVINITLEQDGAKHTLTYTYNDGDTLKNMTDALQKNLPLGTTVRPNNANNGIAFVNTNAQPLKITSVSTTTLLGEVLSKALQGKEVPGALAGVPEILDTEAVYEVPIQITGLSIRKASTGEVFNDNILMDNNLAANQSITSRRFLSVADTSSKIVNLFDTSGTSFGFNEDETINFNASIGGSKVTNSDLFNVGSASTIQDLTDAMEVYLGLGPDHSSFKNVTLVDGAIQVTGEKGLANNIDFFTLSSPLSKNIAFNNAMSSYQIKQAASGGHEATSIDIYDEQGNRHVINFQFSLFNEERNEWRMNVSSNDPNSRVAINGATTNELIMKFNSDGTLAYLFDRFTTPSKIIVSPSLRFSAANGTNTLDNIALNLGTQGSNDGMSLAAGTGGFRQNSSNGYAMGELKDKMFNPAGELVGTYSNGQVRTLAQIALATFTNMQGLLKVGDTMFAETGSSGPATLGQAQSGGRGDIAASSLERSNVDISEELVSMITTQRGFQANSKVITTSDEMILTVLDLKR